MLQNIGRCGIGTSIWRPNLRRRAQLLDRQAGGIIVDTIQGILSLPDSSIQRRMAIKIDIFIVHWVLTLNSHYGTKLVQERGVVYTKDRGNRSSHQEVSCWNVCRFRNAEQQLAE